MHRSTRLSIAVILATAAVLAFGAPSANAHIDPVWAGSCLISEAGTLTAVVDPSVRGAPLEISTLRCLSKP